MLSEQFLCLCSLQLGCRTDRYAFALKWRSPVRHFLIDESKDLTASGLRPGGRTNENLVRFLFLD